MTLNEFITKEIEDLEKFRIIWIKGINKEVFPYPAEYNHRSSWKDAFKAWQNEEENDLQTSSLS